MEPVGEQLVEAVDLRRTTEPPPHCGGWESPAAELCSPKGCLAGLSVTHIQEDDMQMVTGQQLSFSSNGTAQLGFVSST